MHVAGGAGDVRRVAHARTGPLHRTAPPVATPAQPVREPHAPDHRRRAPHADPTQPLPDPRRPGRGCRPVDRAVDAAGRTVVVARRRRSGFEELLSGVAALPWPAGVVVAGLAWTLMAVVVPRQLGDSVALQGLGGLSAALAPWIAAALVGAAAVSAWRARTARRLADRCTSLETIRALDWSDFERLVAEAYRRRGWRVEGNDGARGPDGGIDATLCRDGATVLVQAKHWRARRVGAPIVRELLGAVTAAGAERGIVVTSGTFSEPARQLAAGVAIELVDGAALLELLGDAPDRADVSPSPQGVAPSGSRAPHGATTSLARTSSPVPSGNVDVAPVCPQCRGAMVVRTARRGPRAGTTFLGCSRFPECRGVRDG